MRNHEYITKMCLGILLKPSACNLIKKILWYRGPQLYYCNRCFPVNFAKYFRIFPRVHFYFLFRTNTRNDTWMRMTSLTVGNFFESTTMQVTWSQLCWKFLLNNYKAHCQQYFERNTTIKDLAGVDQLKG